MIKAYFDGVCEPVNPGGTAGYGAVIFKDNEKLFEVSEIYAAPNPRDTSNNVAEYLAFNSILDYLLANDLHTEEIEIFGDSKLVIYQHSIDPQWNKKWAIKKGYYTKFAWEAHDKIPKFPNLKLTWIPREQNSVADELSKRPLLKAGIQFRIQPQ